MAEDVIALLSYIGWTENRSVHLVGVSLGGMIAQGESRTLISPSSDTDK
jgi:pimeloyl-ACP methyl ester carboxylesterase